MIKKYVSISVILFTLFTLIYYLFNKGLFSLSFYTGGIFTEAEARAIALKTCAGHTGYLSSGWYEGKTKAWLFKPLSKAIHVSNPKCTEVCIVHKQTRTVNRGWLCP